MSFETIQEGDWGWRKLGDIAHLNYGKGLRSDQRISGKIPVYSSAGLTGYHNQPLVNEPGIIVGRKGTVGTVHISEEPFYCIDTAYYIRKSEVQCDFKFLYYLLKTLGLEKMNQDSAVPGLNRNHAHSLPVFIPNDIAEQKRIASILSAFDAKIELSRQTNATLEAIAQAIFKEWFVDFNYPGATGELVDSPLGPIPKGWRVGKLVELCKITMGQSPPGDSYNEDGLGVPFFQGRSDFGFRFPRKRMFTTNPKRFAEKSNTLVSVRAPVGDMNVALENCCIGRGLAAVIERGGNSTFTYYYLNHLTEHFKSFEDNGTVFGSITKKDFESIQCVIPPTKLISLFESTSHIFDELILNNHLEEENLKIIRDSILPRLMNGRIEV